MLSCWAKHCSLVWVCFFFVHAVSVCVCTCLGHCVLLFIASACVLSSDINVCLIDSCSDISSQPCQADCHNLTMAALAARPAAAVQEGLKLQATGTGMLPFLGWSTWIEDLDVLRVANLMSRKSMERKRFRVETGLRIPNGRSHPKH